MWPYLYNFLWRIAPPLIRHYLKRRARLNPAYLDNWDERFGKPYPNPIRNAVWLHAVSVGETRAALPIVHALKQKWPDAHFLITQTTPTGRTTAQQLFPAAQCRYLPYDHPQYVQQFLNEHAPAVAILMETEIWVNLLKECRHRKIPTVLANARLSEKSLNAYTRFATLFRPAFAALSLTLAQSPADKERLEAASANNIRVCGSSKYDLAPDNAAHECAAVFKARIGKRPVVLCASTREKNGVDEAHLLLGAWQAQSHKDNPLLVIVPRHPERFESTCAYARAQGFSVQKRSDNQAVAATTQVWIGDSMGEMFAYYLAADIAFVGGSLVDTGCQNIIEPIACSLPTLFGFSTYNFAAACAAAAEAGAARQVKDAAEWAAVCRAWLENPAARHAVAARAQGFIAQHRGASARMADEIARLLHHRNS